VALAASSSRFFGGAFVSSAWRRRAETPAISSIAARNAASFAFDGLLKTGDFSHELKRSRSNLFVGNGRIEVEEVFDISAHAA